MKRILLYCCIFSVQAFAMNVCCWTEKDHKYDKSLPTPINGCVTKKKCESVGKKCYALSPRDWPMKKNTVFYRACLTKKDLFAGKWMVNWND